MAQAWTEEKLLKQDPLHDVKDEIQHRSPKLKHVDLPQGDVPVDEANAEMEDIVKSHVPEAFLDELKNDHGLNQPALDLGPSEEDFMEDDPLHNVKQEMEHHAPHLKHVESPFSSPRPRPPQDAGGVVKSEVPPAFEEELKDDHGIVKGSMEGVAGDVTSGGPQAVRNVEYLSSNVREPAVLRGRPKFRVGANVENRPDGMTPETAIMCYKDEDDDEEGSPDDAKPEDGSGTANEEVIATKSFSSRGLPARGTPHFRISAHQGMRPGGPLSRDLKSETAGESNTASGEGVGADLSGEIKPKVPRGGLSSAEPRRGGLSRTGSGVPGEQRGGGGFGLARTGSGVPGEQRGSLTRTGSGVPGEHKGSLARTGSGVPGNSLARQGSGAFGGSLGRTGSGIPGSKGSNDLKDFSLFLDSADFLREESPVPEEKSGDPKGVLGTIGDKWNQLNSYSRTPGTAVSKETDEKAAGENVSAIDVDAKAC